MARYRIRWFRVSYLAFLLVLIISILSSVLYVRGLLVKYEASQPERQVEAAISELAAQAQDKDAFWSKYQLANVDNGIKDKYIKLFSAEDLAFSVQGGAAEDELNYQVKAQGMPIAEVNLKAQGPAVSKLIVFSMRDWAIESYKPILEKRNYSIIVPEKFTVSADGVLLSVEDAKKSGDGKVEYTINDAYLLPEIAITSDDGKSVEHTLQGTKILPKIYDYALTLPSTITVKVNGVVSEGAKTADGKYKHLVMQVEKPEIILSDLFGNTINYEGETIPLTYRLIEAPENYTVQLDGKKIPDGAISKGVPRKYDILEGLVENLPVQARYEVAVLKTDAVVTVKDGEGKDVALQEGEDEFDFTVGAKTSDTIPKEIADKVDVLKVAQNWSLFMSNDYSFANMQKLILPESNHYKVAKAYANGVDKNFISIHSLLNPPFTDSEVKNFCQITEDSFSVEISFIKHMQLGGGKKIEDAMNDTFFFVKKDGKWLLAGMKEVQVNEK